MPPFNKVLVANRGEIAIRVMKAIKEMGMKAIAVYSDADKYALHVKYADEAYWIGPSPALESYLNIERIIDAAEKAHADAIHPGYGFLSENPSFVEAVEKAGMVFIGPSASVMNRIKDKLEGKMIARKAGVPTSPGPLRPIESVEEALKIAEEIGYPIMLKAAGGGAGVGIIKVDNPSELTEAFERSKRLAYSAFGRGEIYIEKAAIKPKHIETQLIGDKYGNYVVAFERECTIQRRNQKLIEEAPSPSIKEEERKEIIEASIRFGKEINYFTLGTMEFVFSPVTREFYFLELNKRVQVEHTVTEFITGIDLVKLQIRLATGEYLPFSQEDLKIRGHAIQFRINAEDPLNNFTPQSGYITYYKEPTGPGVRVDSGIEVGSWVPPYYDPLVSKLIVYGQSRDYAIQVGLRALNDYKIGGVKTTIPLYKLILQDPDFWEGNFTTAYISEKMEYFTAKLKEEQEMQIAIAISIYNRTLIKKKKTEQRLPISTNKSNWKTYGIISQSSPRVLW
ncbi:acetyl-CoA carboxylase biotin carboxylase subunit [Sulfolobus sp. E5-1-F]|uniref:acetyl-CoA carboxylase biotin carboxylase subunit n=1 Tax=Sulfolobaceae TaxID=118883 RepID=UPI001296D758|nr:MULTISPECIES: biotin carboxylase N-terminal domain-containing protein [unclassified Sulfolobus]QGA53601.1 acetyl-CoA carboxylase biotin carboxylase subunit [Sulfolobus sp. E5-1-F]QGA68734.1 acetyl-CoA carboxylase biotin carboxylase subunit [Sulfolobus sp. E11-6]